MWVKVIFLCNSNELVLRMEIEIEWWLLKVINKDKVVVSKIFECKIGCEKGKI